MNFSEKKSNLSNQFSGDIDLSAITDDGLRKKAFQIYSTYIDMERDPDKPLTGNWGQAAQAVINLKNIAENPETIQKGQKLRKKVEAAIKSFDLDTGTFPK
ncbi:hypothetical protein ACFL18_00650 [Patescibacteria group bacterium]